MWKWGKDALDLDNLFQMRWREREMKTSKKDITYKRTFRKKIKKRTIKLRKLLR